MAKDDTAATADTEEWEDIKVGIGREWDFDKLGTLEALYIGVNEIQLPEDKWQKQSDGTLRKVAKAHSFGLVDGSGELVFVWGSYEIDEALTEVGINDKVRINFLGRESFTTDGNPRQVKRYAVQRAKR